MKKIIFGVLAAFAFSLASLGLSDLLTKEDTAIVAGAHDVGLPEPIPDSNPQPVQPPR